MPLNPEGRKQAMRSGVILQELFERDGRAPDDFVYVSSPLMRARETMELVRATLGLPTRRLSPSSDGSPRSRSATGRG